METTNQELTHALYYYFRNNEISTQTIREFIDEYTPEIFDVNYLPEGEDNMMIHLAIDNADPSQLTLLFEKFPTTVNGNARNGDGDTPLHLIPLNDHNNLKLYEILRQNCPDLNWKLRNERELTPLQVAQEFSVQEDFEYLLSQDVTYTQEDFLMTEAEVDEGSREDAAPLAALRDHYLTAPAEIRNYCKNRVLQWL